MHAFKLKTKAALQQKKKHFPTDVNVTTQLEGELQRKIHTIHFYLRLFTMVHIESKANCTAVNICQL